MATVSGSEAGMVTSTAAPSVVPAGGVPRSSTRKRSAASLSESATARGMVKVRDSPAAMPVVSVASNAGTAPVNSPCASAVPVKSAAEAFMPSPVVPSGSTAQVKLAALGNA